MTKSHRQYLIDIMEDNGYMFSVYEKSPQLEKLEKAGLVEIYDCMFNLYYYEITKKG